MVTRWKAQEDPQPRSGARPRARARTRLGPPLYAGEETAWAEPLRRNTSPVRITQDPQSHHVSRSPSGVAVSGERAGQPVLRLVAGDRAEPEHSSDTRPPTEPAAEALGVNLYGRQLVDGHDRQKLERLCRYVMRPPLSQDRLQWRTDGRLELEFKNMWKDGTRALALEPHDLLVRLCASIPPPWFNMIRYFGVLSSHSRHRARVVPSVVEPARFVPQAATGDQLELAFSSAAGADTAPNHARSRWGWLLRHVFRADVETCPRCGGPMRWVEAATEQGAIARLLAKHRLAPEPGPERARAASGQLPLPFS